MDIPLKATHLNLRAIINKVHQWHHHQYINSNLHEEEEEEEASLKAVWLLFAAAVYWTNAAATQQSSLIELSQYWTPKDLLATQIYGFRELGQFPWQSLLL